MTMRMSADKSHLLAYLKHTPGFEHSVRSFVDIPISEILFHVRETDAQAYQTCISRFERQGVKLELAI